MLCYATLFQAFEMPCHLQLAQLPKSGHAHAQHPHDKSHGHQQVVQSDLHLALARHVLTRLLLEINQRTGHKESKPVSTMHCARWRQRTHLDVADGHNGWHDEHEQAAEHGSANAHYKAHILEHQGQQSHH